MARRTSEKPWGLAIVRGVVYEIHHREYDDHTDGWRFELSGRAWTLGELKRGKVYVASTMKLASDRFYRDLEGGD